MPHFTSHKLLTLCLFVTLVGCRPAATDEIKTKALRQSQTPAKISEQSPPETELHDQKDPSSSLDDQPNTPGDAAKTLPAPEKQTRSAQTFDERFLFFPAKHPQGNWRPQNLVFEDVWFTTDDDVRLHGWYCPCPGARTVLLYAHGNAGNLSHRSELLARFQRQLQVSVLIFDYRGYGRSAGVPTAEGILRDARAAHKFLAQHAGVQESDIVLMGRSLGGAVVTQLAAEAKPRALVLESTFSSLRDVASHHYSELVAWLVPPTKLDSATQIPKYHGPLLQSHGDADQTIPFASGRKLFQAANEPKTWITLRGHDHNDPQTKDYYARLAQFIADLPRD